MVDLFPMGVGIMINDNIPVHEHEYLMNGVEIYKHDGYGFETSVDPRLLTNDDNIPNIRNFIETSLQEYALIMHQSHNKMKITMSWLAKHDYDIPQYLFPHRHPNSVISGVYYVKADPNEHSGLTFVKDLGYGQTYVQHHADPDLEDPSNQYAVHQATVPVKTGTLVLFPSWANHLVPHTGDNKSPRCCISFNTWWEDGIGIDSLFTTLGKIE